MTKFTNPENLRKPPSLSPTLTKDAARLWRLFNAGQAHEITAAYGLGQMVATALSQSGGRRSTVIAELAAHAGIPPAMLNDFHKLVRVFDPEFIKKCGTRTTRSGRKISLQHLFLLAAINCRPLRNVMVEEFYVADLTVEMLEARIGLDVI